MKIISMNLNVCEWVGTHRLHTEILCLSCLFFKYVNFRINVKKSNEKIITKSVSIMMNSMKPTLLIGNHQKIGQFPTIVYTNGVVTAYSVGMNQLRPMALRNMPDDKFAVGLFRGPISESMINTMPINVDVPSRRMPPRLELMMPCQSWTETKINTNVVHSIQISRSQSNIFSNSNVSTNSKPTFSVFLELPNVNKI